MPKKKSAPKTTSFVPKLVFTLAVGAVVPALSPSSCGGDGSGGAGGGTSSLTVAASGFSSGVFAVAMTGFGGTNSVGSGGAGGAGAAGGTTPSGAGGGTAGGGTGGSGGGTTVGVFAVAMTGFSTPPDELQGVFAAAEPAWSREPRNASRGARARGAKARGTQASRKTRARRRG